MVRHRILAGARKWIGPWEGLVFIRFLKNLMYFIFCLTNPPDMQISSHLTTTTFCPFNNSLANIDASLPNMWCLASTTTLLAQIPDPETIYFRSCCCCGFFFLSREMKGRIRVLSVTFIIGSFLLLLILGFWVNIDFLVLDF